jgi:hypothetical protein
MEKIILRVIRCPYKSNKSKEEYVYCIALDGAELLLYWAKQTENISPKVTRAYEDKVLLNEKITDSKKVFEILLKHHNLRNSHAQINGLDYLPDNPGQDDFFEAIENILLEEAEMSESDLPTLDPLVKKHKPNLKQREVEIISRGYGSYGSDGYEKSFAKIPIGNGRVIKISSNKLDFGFSGSVKVLELDDTKWRDYQKTKKLSDTAGDYRCLDNFVFRRGSRPTAAGLAKYVDTSSQAWKNLKGILNDHLNRCIPDKKLLQLFELFNNCVVKRRQT